MEKFDLSGFIQRLQGLIENKHGAKTALARRAGINREDLDRYLKGYMPGADKLYKIAKACGKSVEWLLTGEESETEPGVHIERKPQFASVKDGVEYPVDANDYVCIPLVQGRIGAGGGLYPDNTIDMKLAFARDWITKKGDPKHMSLIRVSGDSMEPTLLSGDIVLVNHLQNYLDPQGGIYAICIDDSIMIKRLQYLPHKKQVRIISDNPHYEPIETDMENIIINGQVIWYGREIRR